MRKLIVITAALALNAAPIAHAYDGWSPTNPAGGALIDNIRYQPSRTLIQQQQAANPGNCGSAPGYFQFNEDGSASAQRLGAVILAAHLAGKGVAFALLGCSGGGTNGYPVISEVVVYD